jgi:DNA-binding MarR family transcriptional regulator
MEYEAPLTRELLDLVSAVKRMVRQEFNAQSDPGAPSLTQYRMLRRIQDGVRHVGKLAEASGISQPATSIMVNTLVEEGYLRRVPHASDRRQVELHLTAQATTSLETGYQRAFAKIEERLSVLSKSKKKEIAKQIRELSQLLSRTEAKTYEK